MKAHIPELLRIVNTFQKTTFSPDDYKEIILYSDDNLSNFGEFLVDARLRKFLTMMILERLWEKEFIIGHAITDFYIYTYEDEEDEKRETYGPTIIPWTFTGEQLFNRILYDFSFNALIVRKYALIDNATRYNLENDTIIENEMKQHVDNKVIFETTGEIIFTKSNVYVKKGSNLIAIITGLIEHEQERFKKFLEHQEDVGVPHTMYINLLLHWFPGKINVRSLEASK